MNRQSLKSKQKGAATLVVAVMLLIGATLIGLLTAKTVLTETKATADSYRTVQAVAAANYAMDYGINAFENGVFYEIGVTHVADPNAMLTYDGDGDGNVDFPPSRFDQNSNNVLDINETLTLASADGLQTTSANVSYDKDAAQCIGTGGASWKGGLISATGFSDDGLATRTITQCVGPITLLKDDGPDMPLISRSEIALTGNANIINRYTNTNVWSGDGVTIGSSSSMATYIKSPSAGNLTKTELLDTDSSANTQLVSNKNLGNGLDIIDNDPNLDTLTTLDFFENFFALSKDDIELLAKDTGQHFSDIADAIGKSGLIWVEGDQSLNSNGIIGSIDEPAILIVNGDLQATGGPTIYGMLYVVGKLTVAGVVDIVGSSSVEGKDASAPIVDGTGTLNLVYWQGFLDGGAKPIPGLSSVISGSWRDW